MKKPNVATHLWCESDDKYAAAWDRGSGQIWQYLRGRWIAKKHKLTRLPKFSGHLIKGRFVLKRVDFEN